MAYKFDKRRRQLYLSNLRNGMGRGAAAEAAGVDRSTIALARKSDAQFAEDEVRAEVDSCDPVQMVLYQKALAGHYPSIMSWLYNRSHGHWVDKRNPQVVQAPPPEASPQEIVDDLKMLLDQDKNGGE